MQENFLKRSFNNNIIIGIVIGIIIAAFSIFIRSRILIGEDSGFYIYTAQRLLDGQKFFYDFFETNMPLNFYISMIPVLFSRITGINIILSFEIFMIFLGLISITISIWILKQTDFYKNKLATNLIIISMFFCYYLRPYELDYNEFYTKTTFYLALIIPYSLSFLNKDRNYTIATKIVLGICLGIVCSIKPNYFIMPLFLELYYMFQKKKFFTFLRLDVYIAITIFIANILFIYFFVNGYLKCIPIINIVYQPISIIDLIEYYIVEKNTISILLILLICKKTKLDDNSKFFIYVFFTGLITCFSSLGTGGDRYSEFTFFYFTTIIYLIYIFIKNNKIQLNKGFYILSSLFFIICIVFYDFLDSLLLINKHFLFNFFLIFFVVVFYYDTLTSTKINKICKTYFCIFIVLICVSTYRKIYKTYNGLLERKIFNKLVVSMIQNYIDNKVLESKDRIYFLNRCTWPLFPVKNIYGDFLTIEYKNHFMEFSKYHNRIYDINDKKVKYAYDYIDDIVKSELNKDNKLIFSQTVKVFDEDFDAYYENYIDKTKYSLFGKIVLKDSLTGKNIYSMNVYKLND